MLIKQLKVVILINHLIPVYNAEGELVLDKEEFPRPQTTLEGLAELKASFESLADYPLDEEGTTFRKLVSTKISRFKN
jgi:acetyl-CoA C-acetyltransferase